MKQYNILCTSITGVNGKHLTAAGNPHNENEFAAGAIEELLKSKHIAEYQEPKPPKKEDKA